jgi:hypothetical protein
MTDGSTSWFGHVTYVLGTNHVFEGGYSQRANWVTARDIGLIANQNAPDVQRAITLPYTNVLDHVPNIVVGGSNFKGSGQYNERSPEQQIFLNNTNTFGRHIVKAGANVELQVSFSNTAGANAGNYTFATTGIPGVSATNPVAANQFSQAFADFLGGYYSSFNQANIDMDSALQSNIYEAYLEDDVHLTPKLTVLFGARYTYFSPYSNSIYQGNIFHPTLNFYAPAFVTGQAPALTSAGNLCFTAPCYTNGGVPNPAYNPTNGIIIGAANSPFGNNTGSTPKNDVAPRFGFTYDVFGNGRTALRGGYGIYFDQIIGNTAKFSTNQDPPNVATTTYAANNAFANPGSGAGSTLSPQGLQAFQAVSKSPNTQQFSLDLQQQVIRSVSLDIGYYGVVGHHQQAYVDVNQPVAGAYATVAGGCGQTSTTVNGVTTLKATNITAANSPCLNLFRPYQNWSYISSNETIFGSNYNGLQTSMRYNTRKGANVIVNYTYSKALSNANSPQNNANLRAEYGPTASNRSSVFNAAVVYPIPYFANTRHFYGEILGGWQINGIITFGSGNYLTASQSASDPAGLGLLAGGPSGARPNQVGNPYTGAFRSRYPVGATPTYFNPAAFAGVAATTTLATPAPGNAPIGSIIGPGYQVWNLSAYKNFKLSGRISGQFRAETFNTFNHSNPSALSTTVGATNFGQVTAYADPRRMQLGAKFTF